MDIVCQKHKPALDNLSGGTCLPIPLVLPALPLWPVSGGKSEEVEVGGKEVGNTLFSSDTDDSPSTISGRKSASPAMMGFGGTPLSANQARRLTRSKSPPIQQDYSDFTHVDISTVIPFVPSVLLARGWFGRDSEIMLKLGINQRPSSSRRFTTPV
jgi:hypothetical protein